MFLSPSVEFTVLESHIKAVLEQETDLIVRGKAQAAHYRAVRLQLEAVAKDITEHPVYQDDKKHFDLLDEQMARLLCHMDGMDPDFVGDKGHPNWHLFRQEERKRAWVFAGRSEVLAELRMNK